MFSFSKSCSYLTPHNPQKCILRYGTGTGLYEQKILPVPYFHKKKNIYKNYRHAPNIWSDYPAVVIFGRSPTAYRKRQAGYPVRYLSVKKAGYLVIKNRISDLKKKQDIRPNTGMQIR